MLIKLRPEASCSLRPYWKCHCAYESNFYVFLASRRVGFVTFSTVDKPDGWDILFISREEGEEGKANVVWSRKFQDAPLLDQRRPKSFISRYSACVCVTMYTVCPCMCLALAGLTITQLYLVFFKGMHFPQGEPTWLISPQGKAVWISGTGDTVATWSMWTRDLE